MYCIKNGVCVANDSCTKEFRYITVYGQNILKCYIALKYNEINVRQSDVKRKKKKLPIKNSVIKINFSCTR